MNGLKFKSFSILVLLALVSCSTSQDAGKIAAALKTVCDCQEVLVSMSSQGLTLTKDGTNSLGEWHEFLIEGYSSNNRKDTSEKMLEVLQQKGYCEDVFISLDFKEQDNVFEIDNCSWVLE